MERFDLNQRTYQINFSQKSSFRDPEIARACVAVLTSDGQLGTLSHLTIFDDAGLFARDLRDLIGKDSVPVCLSGGWANFPGSPELTRDLTADLRKRGFKLSISPEHSDLLQDYARNATLFADRVVVRRTPHRNNLNFTWGSNGLIFTETRILRFPRIHQHDDAR